MDQLYAKLNQCKIKACSSFKFNRSFCWPINRPKSLCPVVSELVHTDNLSLGNSELLAKCINLKYRKTFRPIRKHRQILELHSRFLIPLNAARSWLVEYLFFYLCDWNTAFVYAFLYLGGFELGLLDRLLSSFFGFQSSFGCIFVVFLHIFNNTIYQGEVTTSKSREMYIRLYDTKLK